MDFLEKLAVEGFTLRMFPAYERHLGVEKYNCVALLEPTPEGRWRRFSSPGYLLDGQIALLIERQGKKFFVCKSMPVLLDNHQTYRQHYYNLFLILQPFFSLG